MIHKDKYDKALKDFVVCKYLLKHDLQLVHQDENYSTFTISSHEQTTMIVFEKYNKTYYPIKRTEEIYTPKNVQTVPNEDIQDFLDYYTKVTKFNIINPPTNGKPLNGLLLSPSLN